MINVYCVKWGSKYDRSFVEKLKDSVSKHLTIEHKFICMTDLPEKEYDEALPYPYLKGVWNKLSLFEKTGKSLYFDLDVEITSNIDWLVWNYEDFKKLSVIDSTKWVHTNNQSEMKFAIRNNTFVNSSVMRWENSYGIFQKFMDKRDLYLRLYSGIDRFLYNEKDRLKLPFKTFETTQISSWLEKNVTSNTIMIYNGKYEDVRPENN